MTIKSINVSGFGKLCNFNLDLTDGVNVIYGANEDGKTTVMAFIKMMFYGSATKGSSEAYKNPRKRYKPQNTSSYGGSITFSHKGKNYRLEREFKGSNSTDKVTLYDLNLLTAIPISSNDIGSDFFSLSVEGFEKSVYIGNIGFEDCSSAGGEINSKLSNLSLTGDEDISYDIIKKRLDAFKSIYVTPRKVGALDALNKQSAALCDELFESEQRAEQINALTFKINRLKAEQGQINQDILTCKDLLKKAEGKKRYTELKAILSRAQTQKQHTQKIEALIRDISPNGKTPTRADLDKVYSSLAVVNSASEQLNRKDTSIDTELSALKQELSRKTESFSEQKQKIDALKLKKAKKLHKNAALGFLGLAAVFAVLAMLLSYAFFIPCGISLAGLITFAALQFTRSAKNKNTVALAEQKLAEQTAEIQNLRLLILEKEQSCDKSALINSLNEQMRLNLDTARNILGEFSLAPLNSAAQIKSTAQSISDSIAKIDSLKASLAAIEGLALSDVPENEAIKELELLKAKGIDENFTPNYDANQKLQVLAQRLESVNEQLGVLGNNLSVLVATGRIPAQITAEIGDLNKRIDTLNKRVAACDLANEVLLQAYSNLRGSFQGVLNDKASKILSGLTSGKYTSVGISDNLTVNLDCGTLTDARHFSSGTLDQAYFSMRLAVAELISQDLGGLPLLLDDAFLQYDDERMKNGFRFLADYKNQSVMFTCRKEFAAFAKTLDGANVINL